MSRVLLTSRFPWLYPLRVQQRQAFRRLRWHMGRETFAREQSTTLLPCNVYRHQSKLRRYLSQDPQDRLWQDNKVRNHALALPHLDGVIIRPGETFSFWRLVGRPSAARGFVEGMQLSQGRAKGGIGGGLCQIANMLHWLALHSPLEVTQRADHSFDPFPDQGRVIPFGSGAALFYNYVDLWLFNPTDQNFQFHLWMTDTQLKGEIRCEKQLPHRYRIIERNAGFEQQGTGWLRHNEIWRETVAKGQDSVTLSTDFLYANRSRTMYEPATMASYPSES
jgi:vancomycin resistance protein VanW